MISNAPFSEVISHILHPIWPLVEWKLLIDTKVLLLRSEIHFTYHNEERATHSQVATTSIRRFPSQSKLTIDPKLLGACITLKYSFWQFLNFAYLFININHLKVSFWQFLNFAGLFGVWSSLWLYHTQSQKLMFFYTRYSSENLIHRYPSIYLFLKIQGLLLQMKYAEIHRTCTCCVLRLSAWISWCPLQFGWCTLLFM